MAQDYILRLIEQVGQMLATILRLRKAGRSAEAAGQVALHCQQLTGLPFDLVKHSSPAKLLGLLATSGAARYQREVILAELLMQDAELSDATAREREALVSRVQARTLIAHALPHLPDYEAKLYRAKLSALDEWLNAVKSG